MKRERSNLGTSSPGSRRIRQNDVDLPSGDFTTDLVTTRLNYSFSPRMFLNARIQYNSTVKEISSNIRFNFIHKPLSDFFLATSGEVRRGH